MRRRGDSDGCGIFLLAATFLAACLWFGDTGPSRRQARERLEAVKAENAALQKKAAELEAKVDYLAKREVAQTVLNKTFIDFANSKSNAWAKPHKVDGEQDQPIPRQDLPTTPKD